MGFLDILTGLATNFIATTSYPGIFFLLVLDSSPIPVPSEAVLPFAGFLASQGSLNLPGVIAAGTAGAVSGAVLLYYFGRFSGETWVKAAASGWGRWLISTEELTAANRWFVRHGEIIVLVARVIPVLRTYISFPAGVAKMPFKKFLLYTSLGSLIWSIFLSYLGFVLGENWDKIGSVLRRFDYLVLAAIIIGLAWLIYRRIKKNVFS